MEINCDLGEYQRLSEAHKDADIMPYIHACNVACGGHAGNSETMHHTVQMALENNIAVGAHPSYPDQANFGRRSMPMDESQLYSVLMEQISNLKSIADHQGAELHHVKPHGALYNDAAVDPGIAQVIVAVVTEFGFKLYGQAHSVLADAARSSGVDFVAEGFVDRRYSDRHRLVPRTQPGALIESVSAQMQQARSLIEDRGLNNQAGQWLHIDCDTLCLHGDHAGALETAKALHELVTRLEQTAS